MDCVTISAALVLTVATSRLKLKGFVLGKVAMRAVRVVILTAATFILDAPGLALKAIASLKTTSSQSRRQIRIDLEFVD